MVSSVRTCTLALSVIFTKKRRMVMHAHKAQKDHPQIIFWLLVNVLNAMFYMLWQLRKKKEGKKEKRKEGKKEKKKERKKFKVAMMEIKSAKCAYTLVVIARAYCTLHALPYLAAGWCLSTASCHATLINSKSPCNLGLLQNCFTII